MGESTVKGKGGSKGGFRRGFAEGRGGRRGSGRSETRSLRAVAKKRTKRAAAVKKGRDDRGAHP